MNHSHNCLIHTIIFIVFFTFLSPSKSTCSDGCDLALASYTAWGNVNFTFICQMLDCTVTDASGYNPQISNVNLLNLGDRLNIPFSCECIDSDYLAHVFATNLSINSTYNDVATLYYSNLTTAQWLQGFNSYPEGAIIPPNAEINVTVNCSCGDRDVSDDYGLFLTYPLQPGETLDSVASSANVSSDLVQAYNPGVNFSAGSGLVFIPGRDKNGSYSPFPTSPSAGISGGIIAGIVVAVVGVVLLVTFAGYRIYHGRVKGEGLLPASSDNDFNQTGLAVRNTFHSGPESRGLTTGGASGVPVGKSVEFSYGELATATDNFSISNKIGQGGFASVFYADLRGEKAAIKKMDMRASKEFLAELKVLTHVHHLNLVRLIGYCVEGSLFLVYEFVDNGNLSQHLRSSGKNPLPWPVRVQIALDSARGLEYIHEHTVPVYIHRDIKTANILIDSSFHAKVADFGLAKLTQVGNVTHPTHVGGTFGYMPPEYAQYGEVSPKVDVFAFGVVIFELISAKEAIVRMPGSDYETRSLITVFEGALSHPDPTAELQKLIDPQLGEDYPLDSVKRMAELGRACTQENPNSRPTMRSVVVALMSLSSTTEEWDIGAIYESQALGNFISGR